MDSVTKCAACGADLQIGDYPFCPHGSIFNVNAARFDPVIIHRDADGNVRFPGASDDPVPAGFEKVELRTIREIRQFESGMNRKERERWERNQQAEEASYSAAQRERRAQLLQEMQHMTPFGRDFARHAMEQNDRRSSGSFDPGFKFDVFSTDASNRAPERSERTGWKAVRK